MSAWSKPQRPNQWIQLVEQKEKFTVSFLSVADNVQHTKSAWDAIQVSDAEAEVGKSQDAL